MKLLIVDDSHQKVELIFLAIKETGLTVFVTHETSAVSARRKLQEEEFDLLLIDLMLPDIAGSPPNPKGGIEFFDLILQDNKIDLPTEILFVTGEDCLITPGRSEVERRGSSLCAISAESTNWVYVLSGQIKLAALRADRKQKSFDFAIITALGSELEAVLNLSYSWKKMRLKGDPTLYYKGHFEEDGVTRTLVAASALQKGMASSASLASKLVLKFKPDLLVMTGICAGVRDKVNLGDVVVGNPTWDWGSGKHAETENGLSIFKLAPKQSELSVGLATLCDEIARSSSFRRNIRAGWEKSVPPGEFHAHVGPMASGASVIANSSVGKEIASQNKDLIAIEMEAFAVMVAAEYSMINNMQAVAIKSVCDFADADKSDDWQQYAAYTSASFADELFRQFYRALQ
ncbi:hypothetical protein [Uliginosibacterium sp. 31-12]|uniref:phosphorylase family protein n=1 Tax=Uliginosibacterium sp. 31-12 TaxID=3062781 RepID=UPI0026E3E8AA|nr:hypothetical protein [Uliginosibacterium sp. 31-12]MDO6387011.1 hypothetical protein [Uliginosibacterium sp. 31-12]